MLIKLGILIVLILGAIVFTGIKMGESIKQSQIKMLFYSLYGMSIFTLFNIFISTYFFIALKHKRGPAGPKGRKGELGELGENGVCDENSCLRKSLQEIIVDKLENDENTDIASKNTISLGGPERKLICSYTHKLKEDDYVAIFKDSESIIDFKSKLISITNLVQLKTKLEDITLKDGTKIQVPLTDEDSKFCN